MWRHLGFFKKNPIKMHEIYLLFLPKGINTEFKILKIILPGPIFIVMWTLRQRIGYAGDNKVIWIHLWCQGHWHTAPGN